MQLNRGNEDPPLARVGTGERGECRGKQKSVLCDEVGAMMEKQLACSWAGAVRPTPCRGGIRGRGRRGLQGQGGSIDINIIQWDWEEDIPEKLLLNFCKYTTKKKRIENIEK